MKHFTGLLAALCFVQAPYALADTCTGAVVNGEYALVFADEFNGGSLDRGKWNTEFLWGPGSIINNEEQYYVNEDQFGYNPFNVGNGTLTIVADKAPFNRSLLYLTSSIYSATAAELLWRTPAGAAEYLVYRNSELVGRVAGGSYLDVALEEGFDYPYEVIALDGAGNTIVTAQLTINTAKRSMPSPPPELYSLKLDQKIYSGTDAELVWLRPNRAGRFEVFRNGTLYRSLVGADYSSLYETGLAVGTDYNYTVIAYDRCDDIIIQDDITINTGDGVTPPPPAVTRLKLVDKIYSKSTAEIFWDVVAGAASYDILFNGNLIENTTGRSHFVDGLVPGIDQAYTVIALDIDGNIIDSENRTLNTADNSFALNRQPYLSGVITSYDSFRFQYGRVEARARMSADQGLWSAFWLLNAYYKQDQPEDPEIDIVEAIGSTPNTANQAYHYLQDIDGDGFHTDYTSLESVATVTDFSENFHVYSVDWSENEIVWYIDGVETKRVEGDNVSNEQMYIIANLAVGGAFPGSPDSTTAFPAGFEIDYIRVYQRQ